MHLGKPSITIECPECGDPIRIDYIVIPDPDLPPNQTRLRPTYESHQCAPTGGEG